MEGRFISSIDGRDGVKDRELLAYRPETISRDLFRYLCCSVALRQFPTMRRSRQISSAKSL